MSDKTRGRVELCVRAGDRPIDPAADPGCACSPRWCLWKPLPVAVRPDRECTTCPGFRAAGEKVKGCNCH